MGTVVPRKESRNAVRPDFRPTCASAALGAQETNEAATSATHRNRTPFIGHLLGRGPAGEDPRLDLLQGIRHAHRGVGCQGPAVSPAPQGVTRVSWSDFAGREYAPECLPLYSRGPDRYPTVGEDTHGDSREAHRPRGTTGPRH